MAVVTDIVAPWLTGFRAGIISGFQNYSGTTLVDLLRLNIAIAPTSQANIFGVLGGDLSGYPNGRRVFDDVFSILLLALTGATIPLFDTSFTPDAAASLMTDGLTPRSLTSPFLTAFPYLGLPYDGFDTPSS